jgi:hypothetical protein
MSKVVRLRGYFTKPKGVREQKSLGIAVLEGSHALATRPSDKGRGKVKTLSWLEAVA